MSYISYHAPIYISYYIYIRLFVFLFQLQYEQLLYLQSFVLYNFVSFVFFIMLAITLLIIFILQLDTILFITIASFLSQVKISKYNNTNAGDYDPKKNLYLQTLYYTISFTVFYYVCIPRECICICLGIQISNIALQDNNFHCFFLMKDYIHHPNIKQEHVPEVQYLFLKVP